VLSFVWGGDFCRSSFFHAQLRCTALTRLAQGGIRPVAVERRANESYAEAARNQPSEKALAAIARLETWLTDPRTGKMTPVGEEALAAARKTLVEGKNGYWHVAEYRLETLALRNGRTHGDDIPVGVKKEGEDFQQAIEDLLDCLHERLVNRVR